MKNFPSISKKTKDLIPYARNSRTHSDEQVTQIASSIREFGFTNPVIIDDKDNIIAGHGRVMAARKLGEAIKDLCDFDPQAFLGVLPTAFEKNKMNAYIFCNKDLVPDYLTWGVKAGYSFNILFWKKPNAIPLGGSHRPDVEYLLVFRKSAIWNNALKDVSYSKCLEYGRENSTPYPTMKPVDMIVDQIKISSNISSPVLDLFGGSGSTLIACEKTGRINRSMELDPKYCDVIIKRWQNFTGKKAIHAETGKQFDELKNVQKAA